jgi:hypothetical protein
VPPCRAVDLARSGDLLLSELNRVERPAVVLGQREPR